MDDMKYKEAVEYIEERKQCGRILKSAPGQRSASEQENISGHERMEELCSRLGDPQKEWRLVLVTGRNGKSSVSAYIATVLKCAGYKAGSYGSPEIYEYRERIRVNGHPMAKQDMGVFLEQVREAAEQMAQEGMTYPSVWEIGLAAAFLYFRKKKCDLVLLEIKEDTVVPIAEIMQAQATVAYTWPADSEKTKRIKNIKYGLEKQRFTYMGWKDLTITAAGHCQIVNSALAVETIGALRERGFSVTERQLRKGLLETQCDGCFTVIGKRPVFLTDGAHNGAAAGELAESLRGYYGGKRLIGIMGACRTEEYEEMLPEICGLAEHMITVTPPEDPEAIPAYDLAKEIQAYHTSVTAVDSLEEAVELGYLLADRNSVILAFGPLPYLGRIRQLAENKNKGKK